MVNKKMILGSIMTTAAVITPVVVLLNEVPIKYKPAFYNYEDYMSQESIDHLSEKFNYTQYGDMPDFEQILKEKRAIGGIAGDYYDSKWANEGLIKKIDFKRALHIKYSSKAELVNILKNSYTKQTWNQMKNFNDYFIQHNIDSDNDGVVDQLWEYMIPYFIQTKTLTFNIKRGNSAWYNRVKSINNQAGIDALFPDKTYLGMLKTLHENGYNNLVINDYARDNMMIGSELNGGHFTGSITEGTYKKYVDDFVDTLKQGMNIDSKNGHETIYETSGTEALDHLVNQKENWGASFIYNGDALFAHNGGSNESPEGENIRIVVPKNPIYLLDGMVIANGTDKKLEDIFYKQVYESFLRGWSEHYDETYKTTGAYGDNMPAAAVNFDSVNYTTPYRDVYEHFKKGGLDDYFKGENPGDPYDVFGEEMFHLAPADKQNKDTKIDPIDDGSGFKIMNYYTDKTS